MSDHDTTVGRPAYFREIRPDDLVAVSRFFEQIARDQTSHGFRPHPFDEMTARGISEHLGRDLYAIGISGDSIVTYGMLRGWDAGYSVPSLGIYVAPFARGTAMASQFMGYLHAQAAARDASLVRLTVDGWNRPAMKLYERHGYRFRPHPEAGRLIGELALEAKHQG